MNAQNDPQNPLRDQIQIQPDEQPYDGGGWPGDGSGTDDLADLMATGDEGCCDYAGD